ncbi:hypothetical protein EMMF5_005269 [Cystobasidiomycetes sp. EMM_F5]
MKNYPFTLDIKFLPYLINEDLGDKQAISKAELFESKFIGSDNAQAVRSKISAEGEKEGIKFSWDTGAKVRQTRRAHRIIEKAYEVGSFELQARIAERLYSAFHAESIDVGDPEELARIAASESGFVSYKEALAFIESDEGEYELDKALQKAKHWGIDQVPTYILDSTDAFREAISPEQWFKHLDVLSRAYGLTQ